MRAHWHIRRFTRADCLEAIRIIEDLLQRDPTNALALADLAYNWHMGGFLGWTKEPIPVAMERMGEAAHRAVACKHRDATAQTSLALYELFSNQHDDAIKRLKRAIELDPNSSFARGNLGVAFNFGGEPDLALAALDEAKRLSPLDYLMVIWHTASAWSHLSAERFAEAIDCAKQAIEFNPNFPDTHGVAGRVRGASRTHGGGALRARGLCAFAAGIDLGRSAADSAVPPSGGSRALPLRPAQSGAARLIGVTRQQLSFVLAGCPDAGLQNWVAIRAERTWPNLLLAQLGRE